MKLADTRDLKSLSGDRVRVRPPSAAWKKHLRSFDFGCFLFAQNPPDNPLAGNDILKQPQGTVRLPGAVAMYGFFVRAFYCAFRSEWGKGCFLEAAVLYARDRHILIASWQPQKGGRNCGRVLPCSTAAAFVAGTAFGAASDINSGTDPLAAIPDRAWHFSYDVRSAGLPEGTF